MCGKIVCILIFCFAVAVIVIISLATNPIHDKSNELFPLFNIISNTYSNDVICIYSLVSCLHLISHMNGISTKSPLGRLVSNYNYNYNMQNVSNELIVGNVNIKPYLIQYARRNNYSISYTDAKEIKITNKIHFKKEWKNKYTSKLGKFNGKTVNFITSTDKYYVSTTNKYNYDIVTLDYKDKDTKMTIIRPRDRNLEDVFVRYTSLQQIKHSTRSRYVEVWIPEFDINCNIELKDALFSINKGPFNLFNINTELQVTSVFQNTNFSIDETGATASSSTQLTIRSVFYTSRNRKINIDTDFVFIVYKNTDILFIGKVVKL